MKAEMEIQDRLVQLVIIYSRLPEVTPALNTNFDSLGLDSIDLVTMSAAIEEFLGVELSPIILHDHPNIETLSKYLFEQQPR